MSFFEGLGEGSIWDSIPASALSGILNRSHTLDELMMEDDVVQEVVADNTKLLESLTTEEHMKALIGYIALPQEGHDVNKTYRFPYIACEIVCCKSDPILDAIMNPSAPHFDTMLEFLRSPSPQPPYRASYFGKVFKVLCQQRPITMLTAIQTRPGLQLDILRHLNNPSIVEVLQAVFQLRFHPTDPLASLRLSSSDPASVVDVLLSLMRGDMSATGTEDSVKSDTATNAADFLVSMLDKALVVPPACASPAASADTFPRLDAAYHRSSPSPTGPVALTFLKELRDGRGATDLVRSMSFDPEDTSTVSPALLVLTAVLRHCRRTSRRECPRVVVELLPRLESMVKFLTGILESAQAGRRRSFGLLSVAVIDVVLLFAQCPWPTAEVAVIDMKVFTLALDLMFAFPWNNILHNRVETNLIDALTKGTPGILHHIVVDAKLPSRIASAWRAAQSTRSSVGYTGHLINICNAILAQYTSWGADVVKEIEGDSLWWSFVDTELVSANLLRSMQLGGPAPDHRQLSVKGPGHSAIDEVDTADASSDTGSKF